MKPITANGISGCQQCSRLFGEEMVACPERRGGNCPFTNRNRNSGVMRFSFRLIGAAIFLIPLLLLIVLAGVVARAGLEDPSELICVPVSLLIMAVGLAMIWNSNLALWDSKNNILWARKSLLGIEFGQKLTVTVPDRESKQLTPAPARLSHPGSHVQYYSYYKGKDCSLGNMFSDLRARPSTAVPLFEAAFADLLARELIQVQPCIQYVTSGRKCVEAKSHICRFVPGPRVNGKESNDLGWLEARILDVITSWQSEPCPEGLPVYHLVRAVFDGDRANPWIWPISVVEKDMIRTGKAKRAFVGPLLLAVPVPEIALQLEEEQPKLLKLEEWMGNIQALTDTLFLEGIQGAIKSRKAQEVDVH